LRGFRRLGSGSHAEFQEWVNGPAGASNNSDNNNRCGLGNRKT
jgi:hypothetical protein